MIPIGKTGYYFLRSYNANPLLSGNLLQPKLDGDWNITSATPS
jgi:hypothetical protein